MASLYCEPRLRDFGLADPGWRGFGGILTDPRSGSEIPQYNLAAFWKRPIAPVITGFAELISQNSGAEITTRRPPGSFRADMDSSALHNVNHLAARRRSSQEVTVWTVSENLKQNSIQESNVLVQSDITLSEAKLNYEVSIDDPVMELRLTEVSTSQLWTRCKRHLSLLEPSSAATARVFRGSVRSFEECKSLPGDVALCDMAGMVWSGTIGTSLSRTKTISTDAKMITYSDHPRVVFVSSTHQVRNVDLRIQNTFEAPVLFNVPELARKGPSDSAVYIPEEALETPHICHLRSLPDHPHNFYVLTTHNAYLCDDRFPRNPVLTLPHTIPYGAHVLQISNLAPDPQGSGGVVSVYFLDHLLTGIWVSRLYIHSCNVWSSVLPIHKMEDCSSLEKLVKPLPAKAYKRNLRRPVMGMAVVQGFKDEVGRPAELLLRALNDGSVWYQTMRYGKVNLVEMKTLWAASQERVKASLERAGKSDLFMQPLPRSMRRSVDSLCTTVNLEDMEDCVGEVSKRPWRPLQKRVNKMCQPLELLPSTAEAVLPRVINEVWRNAMEKCCGFRGSLGFTTTDAQGNAYNVANLAQTYSALLCLAILGDDFQEIDREAILQSLRSSQKEDGSFWSEGYGSESDMRFVFCAVAICHILQDYSYINWSALRSFIRASLNYDGGIGQGPGDESHGGSTFCAIASLSLSNRLWDESVLSRNEINRLVKWALWKQDQGFHGRAHKDDDSCYAFWIGATLEILNANHLLDKEKLRSFLLIAQHQPLGGFCKVPDPTGFPDLLHTYFSLAAFSLLREPGFSPIHASLNVSRHVYEHILKFTHCHV